MRDILDALASVQTRATRALEVRDFVEYSKLTGDLFALECCLRIEAEKLVNELDAA